MCTRWPASGRCSPTTPASLKKLHLHAAFGRDDQVTAGCIRKGVKTWIIGEAVVIELVGTDAGRHLDADLGFELLDVDRRPQLA